MSVCNYADRLVCSVDKSLFCSLLPMSFLVCVSACACIVVPSMCASPCPFFLILPFLRLLHPPPSPFGSQLLKVL